jgi:hypothetical protein
MSAAAQETNMAAQHGCSAAATSAGPVATSAVVKVKVCFAEARNNTKKDSIHDFQDLLDDESKRFSYEKKDQYVRTAADIIQMATCQAGFRLEHDQVFCPVVVVQESDDISFDMATLNVTFGDINNRPKMMTTKAMKMDILSKMQGTDVDGVCKDQCEGVLVGLKGIECLVLISLRDTAMRLEEIQNGAQRSERTGRYRSETRALHRCLGVLAGLAPYVHSFGDDVVYGFKTSVVNGNSQRVTKSQVQVSKLLWRGIFEGHRSLMTPSLLDRVFQTRSKKRKAEDDNQVEEHPVTAGKSHAFKSYAGKQALKVVQDEDDTTTMDADDIVDTLTTTLDHRRQSIGDKTVDYLSYFVTKYRETVEDDVFIQDLGDMCANKQPETELQDQMNEFLEAPECSQLRTDLETQFGM